MIQLIQYKEEEHYEMLKAWWDHHGWEGVHPQMLNPIAYFAEFKGKLTCFAVLWTVEEAGVAIMEWIVSNPESKPIEVYKALNQLTSFYEELCKEHGYAVLLTTCKQEGLSRIHQRNGFERCDEGMIHLAKTIT